MKVGGTRRAAFELLFTRRSHSSRYARMCTDVYGTRTVLVETIFHVLSFQCRQSGHGTSSAVEPKPTKQTWIPNGRDGETAGHESGRLCVPGRPTFPVWAGPAYGRGHSVDTAGRSTGGPECTRDVSGVALHGSISQLHSSINLITSGLNGPNSPPPPFTQANKHTCAVV